MDIVISEAVAADPGDPLSCEEDPVVSLDPSWDLETTSQSVRCCDTDIILSVHICVCVCVSYSEVESLVQALSAGRAPQYGLSHRDEDVRVDVRPIPPEHRAPLDLQDAQGDMSNHSYPHGNGMYLFSCFHKTSYRGTGISRVSDPP